MPVITLEEPRRPVPPDTFALWALGFRPFYLVASIHAALSVLLWAAQVAGWLPFAYLQGATWHAHEMLFGFVLAVVIGFLFTAGHNWTGRPTPTGALLMGLTLLWIAGRVLVLTPWREAAMLVNVAFPFAAAACLAVPFIAARNTRNYFFIGLLALMGCAQLQVHLSALGVVAMPAWAGLSVGLDVILFIMAVMGGRVIPMFTNNGVPGTGAVRHAHVEKAALGLTLALIAVDLAGAPAMLLLPVAALAAVAHGVRLALWRGWRTRAVPLVWVLHLAYLWIVLHLALRVAAAAGWIAPTAATHALTAGAIGGLTIGMMTRTARGHTGRLLRADRWEVAAYLLVALAAVVRVFVPLVVPAAYVAAVGASGLLWSAGFGIYAVRYWPILTRARPDGRPG